MTTDMNKTGESNYRKQGSSYDEITFNGNKGIFYLRAHDAEKDEKTGKYPKTAITHENTEGITVVFLRIRRLLSHFAKRDGKYAGMRTSEHSNKNNRVVLYKPDGKEYGIAADLRAKYEKLKTTQIVYAYLPTEDKVVKLVIKGSSLGSDFKHPKGVLKFYDYLQSIPKEDSSTEYETTLVPLKEEGPNGEYYALSFVRGKKIDEETHAVTRKLIDIIHEEVEAHDKRVVESARTAKDDGIEVDESGTDDDDEGSGGIDYPKDDINPDDIPF